MSEISSGETIPSCGQCEKKMVATGGGKDLRLAFERGRGATSVTTRGIPIFVLSEVIVVRKDKD